VPGQFGWAPSSASSCLNSLTQTIVRAAINRNLRGGATNTPHDKNEVTFTLQGDNTKIQEIVDFLKAGKTMNNWGARCTAVEEKATGMVRPFLCTHCPSSYPFHIISVLKIIKYSMTMLIILNGLLALSSTCEYNQTCCRRCCCCCCCC